jgi:hypothetical protein
MKKFLLFLILLPILFCFSACSAENGEFTNNNPVGQVIYKSDIINRTCSIRDEVLKVVVIIVKAGDDEFLIMESNDGFHNGGRTSDTVNKSEQNYEAVSRIQLNKTYCFFTDDKSPSGKYRKIISFKDVE